MVGLRKKSKKCISQAYLMFSNCSSDNYNHRMIKLQLRSKEAHVFRHTLLLQLYKLTVIIAATQTKPTKLLLAHCVAWCAGGNLEGLVTWCAQPGCAVFPKEAALNTFSTRRQYQQLTTNGPIQVHQSIQTKLHNACNIVLLSLVNSLLFFL